MKAKFKKKLDLQAINNIKSLGIDMINAAGSGHPGIVLGAAPIIYTLYSRHLNMSISNPGWIGRDRFILSAGHGSALLYSTLFMMGYNIKVEDLKNFRQLNSILPGHPEYDIEHGVEASSGPLGQGIANAVGLAIGETYIGEKFKGKGLISNYTYTLVSDGDLMEGISSEAASLAGNLKLNKLIVLYDSNNVSLDGSIKKTFTEDVLGRFNAFGWNTIEVEDGTSVKAIDKAIKQAKKSIDRPTIIKINTIIGLGSKNQGTNKAHGTPLSEKEIEKLKAIMDLPQDLFYFDEKVKEYVINNVNKRMKVYKKDWDTAFELEKDNPDLTNYMKNKVQIDLKDLVDEELLKSKGSLRELNGKIMSLVARECRLMLGGSADLASSNKTYLKIYKDYSPTLRGGRNIWYGVREHAMGAISNGLALYGLRPFASTFLTFSDYLKPSIRLSALMNLPVTYIFTHDSINIGEDGPTHQPIEQLVGLRSIPNLNVFRPADIKEIQGVWQYIVDNKEPSAIILSRNKVDLLKNTNADKVKTGAYIVDEEKEKVKTIIIATGSELSIACKIKKELKDNTIRVVSMPSINKFLEMDEEYRKEILPTKTKKIIIEASSSYSWHQFVTNDKYLITLNNFGKSGKKDDVLKEFNFDYESILNKIKELI